MKTTTILRNILTKEFQNVSWYKHFTRVKMYSI